MTGAYDLAQVRDVIAARIARRAIIEQRFAAFDAQLSRAPKPGTKVVARCDQPGHKGGTPMLAQMWMTDHGILFVSKIDWLPSDQLNLRPWQREAYLGAGASGILSELDDDSFLANWLEQLDTWSDPDRPASGPRWLKSQGPHFIREVLDLPDPRGRLSLWTRCRDHPAAAEELSVEDLLNATR